MTDETVRESLVRQRDQTMKLRDRYAEALRWLRLWYDALMGVTVARADGTNSPEYQQTQGCLFRTVPERDPDGVERAGHGVGFCCLGVVADIVRPNGWTPAPPDLDGTVTHMLVEKSAGSLPDSIKDILMVTGDEHQNFITANDTENWTFAQIAARLVAPKIAMVERVQHDLNVLVWSLPLLPAPAPTPAESQPVAE